MTDEPELPKKIDDVLRGSVAEAFLLYDEVAKLAESQAGVEPEKYHTGLILRILFCKLGERMMQDGWTIGDLTQLLIEDAT